MRSRDINHLMIEIRPAGPGDEDALAALDLAAWTWLASPAPRPDPDSGWTFFDERTKPHDVLVALADGAIAGYVKLGRPTPLAASEHVVMVNGLVVAAERRRLGVGRALLYAAMAEAEARGARRLTLRVLGPNEAARGLYEAVGFVEEGILRGEFVLEGRAVDDVLMARGLRGTPR
jgi:ribosomal protein S18 acetylase RimI-like enzyme